MCCACAAHQLQGPASCATSPSLRPQTRTTRRAAGSMTAAGRMGHAKTAGMWVLNTLTDVDRASVVDFNSQATKARRVCA